MLATLTACNNSESQISSPEDQTHQTFQSKTTAREGEENPDEKEAMNEAIEIIYKDSELGGGTDSRILCHTPYGTGQGHACVQLGITLVSVDWGPIEYWGSHGEIHGTIHGTLVYTGHVVTRCNCR